MKKKFFSLLVTALLVISVMPLAFAVEVGEGIGLDIDPEPFEVLIWKCEDYAMQEDCVEEGRGSDCTDNLMERIGDYAFEGEQLGVTVLVMDKNKIEEVEDVVGTLGASQGAGNDIEVECDTIPDPYNGHIPASCAARILEEDLTGTPFDEDTQAYYRCLFTVETPDSMQGEYWYTVEAIATDSEDTLDENYYWFLNPILALAIDGDVEFSDVRPGSVAYSSTLLIGNDAEEGSGVMMDMFISGTDFYDPDNSGARCPDTNQLQLSETLRSPSNIESTGGATDADGPGGPEGSGTGSSGPHTGTACTAGTTGITDDIDSDHLCYYASNGAYTTGGASNADTEGYVPIVYGDTFARYFYNDAEVIRNPGVGATGDLLIGGASDAAAINYHAGNLLSPGTEIAVTFKLGLPEPCVGSFSDGAIYFWGEAI
ncbi:MAG: hypothetical protein ABIB47_00240 [Candidatus Woesearchaeota archaeon]